MSVLKFGEIGMGSVQTWHGTPGMRPVVSVLKTVCKGVTRWSAIHCLHLLLTKLPGPPSLGETLEMTNTFTKIKSSCGVDLS